MAKQNIFMQYICKNCGRIYLDKDVKGRMTPIKGYYCQECCKKMGIDFDAQVPKKKKLSQKQIKVLKKNQFVKRKKSSDLNDIHTLDIGEDKNEN